MYNSRYSILGLYGAISSIDMNWRVDTELTTMYAYFWITSGYLPLPFRSPTNFQSSVSSRKDGILEG